MQNSTLSGNSSDFGSGITGTVPLLAELADNGGGTLTHALLPACPLSDAGNNDGCPSTDQRGLPRPAITSCDIRPYENQAASNINLTPDSVTENQPVGTAVGSLINDAPDLNDSHTYTMVDTGSYPDNDAFTISGGVLQTAVVSDF